MNQDHHDIDRLLKNNVKRQLAGFDYDRYADSVARRLATDDLRRRPDRPILRSLAVAAGIVLGLAALTLMLSHLRASRVDVTGRSGTAKVVTEPSKSGRATVAITHGRTDAKRGRCVVQIHRTDKPSDDVEKSTRWCIVTLPEPPVQDIGLGRDNMNLACLF